MKNINSLHPITLFIYFTSVITIGMFASNPVLLTGSLFGAISFYATIFKKHFFRDLLFFSLLFIMIALVNPLFSHNGTTVFFFLSGNPITYESILYGINTAVMIISIIYWFKSFTIIMTSDKILFLFGGILPKLSVILSSALRYLPLLRKQITKINTAQKSMGLYSKNNIIDNIKGALRVFSVSVTWSLENAVDTADSMKARGYGLLGRSRFSIFSFRKSDFYFLIITVLLNTTTILGIAFGLVEYQFYPSLSTISTTMESLVIYISFGLLSLLPLFYQYKEKIKWIYFKSKI